MPDDFDLDALVEEAAGKQSYAEDYVGSTKKDGELVPKGKHDVHIGYVAEYGVTDWGTESLSLVLKMDDTKRSWWVNLDFAVQGDTDKTDKSITATLKKFMAIGFSKDDAKALVRDRKTIDWDAVLNGLRLQVNVKHNDANGVTYANTYFNKRNGEVDTGSAAVVDTSPAPQGEGTPVPSNLPHLG